MKKSVINLTQSGKHLRTGYSVIRSAGRHLWQNIMSFSIPPDQENMTVRI